MEIVMTKPEKGPKQTRHALTILFSEYRKGKSVLKTTRRKLKLRDLCIS